MLEPFDGMKQYEEKRARQHEFSLKMAFYSVVGMLVLMLIHFIVLT